MILLPTGRGVLPNKKKYKSGYSLFPPMTTTAAGGYAVTEGSMVSATNAGWRLFDKTSGLWSTTATNLADCWVEINIPAAVTFYGYKIRPRFSPNQTEMPSAWEIQYAADDSSPLTVADVRSGQSGGTGEEQYFEFNTPVRAKRLRFQATARGTSATTVSLEELDYLQVVDQPVTPTANGAGYNAASGAIGATAAISLAPGAAASDFYIGFTETANLKAASSPVVFSQGTYINLVRDYGPAASYLNITATRLLTPSVTLSVPDTGDHQIMVSTVLKNVDTITPFGQVATAMNSVVNGTFPSVTTTIPNSLILYVISNGYLAGNSTNLTNVDANPNPNLKNFTLIMNGQNNAGNGGGVKVWYGIAPQPGPVGEVPYNCLTVSGSGNARVVATIVVNPRVLP